VVSFPRHERPCKTRQTPQVRCGLPRRSPAPGRAKPLDPSRRPGAQHRPETHLLMAKGRPNAGSGHLNTSWVGTWGPRCRKNWSPRPYSGPFLPNHLPRTLSSTPTAAASTAATLTAPSCTGTGPYVRRAAAANATTMPRLKTDQRFWMPLVPPQNRGARTARVARFCRPGRRASQHRRLF